MSQGPRYSHTCDSCTFLGRFGDKDLWHCTQDVLPTVIARYGPLGNYTSGMEIARRGLDPDLVEARNRAIHRGLRCD